MGLVLNLYFNFHLRETGVGRNKIKFEQITEVLEDFIFMLSYL